jgi:hypothetical protein
MNQWVNHPRWYIYIHGESILHVLIANMGPAQDPFAMLQGGSFWLGYNIPAVSYNSDSTSLQLNVFQPKSNI